MEVLLTAGHFERLPVVSLCRTRYANDMSPNHVRMWRKHRKLTQEALADLAGLTPGAISRLETGKIKYTEQTLTVLARALDCGPADLISRGPNAEDEDLSRHAPQFETAPRNSQTFNDAFCVRVRRFRERRGWPNRSQEKTRRLRRVRLFILAQARSDVDRFFQRLAGLEFRRLGSRHVDDRASLRIARRRRLAIGD